MRPLILPCVAFLLALSAPAASAHGISPVPPDYFQVLLQDRTDDCGPEAIGGTGGAVQNPQDCHGAHALVGLAVQEKWDGAKDQLVFRFYLDVGKRGPFTDTLTLDTPEGGKTLAIRSTDDRAFTSAGGFESVGSAQPSPGEKTRFTVDATLARETLGVAVGEALTNFRVESRSGSQLGDIMPGGCHNTVGDCTAPDDGEFIYGGGTGSYTVRGPSYYVRMDAPSGTQRAVTGQDLGSPLSLPLRNLLRSSAQTLTVSVAGADGVAVGFHAGGSGMGVAYSPTLQIPLDANAGTTLHLNLHGQRAGASGTLVLTATSDLGGRTQASIPYTVADGAPTGTTPTDATGSTSQSAPAAMLAWGAILLLGLALARRS